MIANELISAELITLRTSDTGNDSLKIMNEFSIRHLPIVNNTQLLGVISEEDILSQDPFEPVGSYTLSLNPSFVNIDDHLFDIMRIMAEANLTVIPVVDAEDNYVGLISLEKLLHFFAKSFTFSERGSIIVLDVTRSDYSLQEISGIVEMEDAVILAVFLNSKADSHSIQVTLKVNKQETRAVVASLERYKYKVSAVYSEPIYFETLQHRYDELMKYLSI